jgi:hypothetical protein
MPSLAHCPDLHDKLLCIDAMNYGLFAFGDFVKASSVQYAVYCFVVARVFPIINDCLQCPVNLGKKASRQRGNRKSVMASLTGRGPAPAMAKTMMTRPWCRPKPETSTIRCRS